MGQSSAVLPAVKLPLSWTLEDPVSLVPPRSSAAHTSYSTFSHVPLEPLHCPPPILSIPSLKRLSYFYCLWDISAVFGDHSLIANYHLLERISNMGNKQSGDRGVFLNHTNTCSFIRGQKASKLEATSPLSFLITSWSEGISSITSGQ